MNVPHLAILEKENRTKAFWLTLVINILLFLLFYYIKALDFQESPQYSSEIPVEFGTDNVGSGSIKTRNTPNNLKDATESAPPKVTKVVPKPTPIVPKKVEVKVKPKAEPKIKTKAVPDPPVKTTTNESPVKVKDAPAKTTPTPSKPVESANTGKSTPEPAKPTPAPTPPQPKVDEAGIFKSKGGNGTRGTSTNPGGNNNGDDKGKVGDKGQPDGGDEGVFKGKPGNGGTGGAVNLNLTGFKFSSRPQLKDPYDETGKIVFKIKVDADGEIVSLTVAETNLSSQVVNWYKQRLSQLAIVPTSDGQRPTASSGTIYINIVAK